MDIGMVSTFWLLWLMLLWTLSVQMSIKAPLSVLLGVYAEVELLDHMTTVCLMLWGAAVLPTAAAAPLHIPNQQCPAVPISPLPLQHLLFSGFRIMIILMGVKGVSGGIFFKLTKHIPALEPLHLLVLLLNTFFSQQVCIPLWCLTQISLTTYSIFCPSTFPLVYVSTSQCYTLGCTHLLTIGLQLECKRSRRKGLLLCR